MFMRNQETKHHHVQSLTVEELIAASVVFTDTTRVVENTIHAKEGVWRLGFNNGHAIVICADGTCRNVKEEDKDPEEEERP